MSVSAAADPASANVPVRAQASTKPRCERICDPLPRMDVAARGPVAAVTGLIHSDRSSSTARDGRCQSAAPAGFNSASAGSPEAGFYCAAPLRARRATLTRSVLSSTTLRRRTLSGVASTHSSSRRNSRAWSSDSVRWGTRRTRTSAVEERMLVFCFSRVTLTSMSSARAFSPHDHALVDLVAGADEQRPALLEVVERELRRTPARSATSAPVGRVRSSPAHGAQRSKTWWSSAGAARLGEELGAKADAGRGRGSRYDHAHPAGRRGDASLTRPLRGASSWVTVPTCSSGTSMQRSRPARERLPSISRVITSAGSPSARSPRGASTR